MSWRDIVRKGHCKTEKTDDEELKAEKPDFLDLDKDGNKKEPMKEAAKDAKGRRRGTVVPKTKSKNPFTRKD